MASTNVTVKAASSPASTVVAPTIFYPMDGREWPTTVVLVGAGGVGARIAPALPKLLRPGDRVIVVDDDIVEDRNLRRQHFGVQDVGKGKAEVMSLRYHTNSVPVLAINAKLDPFVLSPMIQAGRLDERGDPAWNCVSTIIIGAVDNQEARIACAKLSIMLGTGVNWPCLYIDCGNEMRSGQVLLDGVWYSRKSMVNGDMREFRGLGQSRIQGYHAMPQLWEEPDPETSPEENCATRIDLQTMCVNNTAACLALNAVASILNAQPMMACGWHFTSSNSVQPIGFDGPSCQGDPGGAIFKPETIYAKEVSESDRGKSRALQGRSTLS